MEIQTVRTSKWLLSNRVWNPIAVTLLLSLFACGGTGVDTEKQEVPQENEKPTISITTPSNEANYFTGDLISFLAEANDKEDGDLSNQITWTSDIDGVIGSGNAISVSISEATHQITASVTDSNNQSESDLVEVSVNSYSGIATLSWNSPVENTDNTQLTDLAGFIVYYGESANELVERIVLNSPSVESVVVNNLKVDTRYYFAVSAFNELQVESELSEVVDKLVVE